MKVVFMGTPDFAVPTLRGLIEHHEVVAVISQPDKPKGRGRHLMPTPVKEVAMEHNIPVYQPASAKDPSFIELLGDIEADVFVVVAYGQLLPESILNMPKYGCINVHGSLLPKYRGAGPIQWSIINGETVTGVTIMYMEKGLDTGDMILKKEIPIEPNDDYGTLHDKMCLVGAKALLEALYLMERGQIKAEKQDDSLSNYAPRITKDIAQIVWTKTSREIINLIRGLRPTPCALTFYDEQMIKVWWAEEIEGYEGRCGEIVDVLPKKGIVVKTGDTAVVITELQVKGGKRMRASDYLLGNSLEKGKVFKYYQTIKITVRK